MVLSLTIRACLLPPNPLTLSLLEGPERAGFIYFLWILFYEHWHVVDQCTYLSSNISSTVSNVNIVKAWTAIDGLLIIWKPDLSYKIKLNFYQTVTVSVLLYGCILWVLTKCMEKKLDGNYKRMLHAILNKSWKQQPTRQQLLPTNIPSHKPFK